jgi:Zn-dependent peptidase ImmA (M78 family)
MKGGVNSAILVLAREARGRTQDELAEQSGISQSLLSKYENSLREPSEEHMAKLADCLRYPRDLFYRTDAPLAPGCCLHHRKRASMPRRALREFDAQIGMTRLHISRLFDGARMTPGVAFPQFDIAEFNNDIPRIAEMVRLAWRMPMGPVRNLIEIIERAGGIVASMQFSTHKLSAICHSEAPPMFFVNSDVSTDHFRWSLAHEIGHLVMHRTPTVDQEREADKFAAEFLMPAREIASDLAGMNLSRAAELKPVWRVAMSALIRRAKDVGAISERQYQRLMVTMNANRWLRAEPVEIAEEAPTLLSRLVQCHLNELRYTTNELAALMGLQEDELRTRFLNEPQRPRLVQ